MQRLSRSNKGILASVTIGRSLIGGAEFFCVVRALFNGYSHLLDPAHHVGQRVNL